MDNLSFTIYKHTVLNPLARASQAASKVREKLGDDVTKVVIHMGRGESERVFTTTFSESERQEETDGSL